jgi:hypothetical protein
MSGIDHILSKEWFNNITIQQQVILFLNCVPPDDGQ